MYTHLDGPRGRVPVGQFKIGRIAQEGRPDLTNKVQEDNWVGDPVSRPSSCWPEASLSSWLASAWRPRCSKAMSGLLCCSIQPPKPSSQWI